MNYLDIEIIIDLHNFKTNKKTSYLHVMYFSNQSLERNKVIID